MFDRDELTEGVETPFGTLTLTHARDEFGTWELRLSSEAWGITRVLRISELHMVADDLVLDRMVRSLHHEFVDHLLRARADTGRMAGIDRLVELRRLGNHLADFTGRSTSHLDHVVQAWAEATRWDTAP